MHKDDQMTSSERVGNFLQGKEIDRIPIMPLFVTVSGKAAGMTHREKRSSAANEAKAQLACHERFGNDLLIMEYGLHGIGKALGTKANDPENGVPALIEFALADLNNLDVLDMAKLERKNDANFQRIYEAVQLAYEQSNQEVPVGVLISGPFTAAASIYQTEFLLRAMRKNPQQLHKLIGFCTEALKMICKEFVAIGAVIGLCDPIASGTILRQKQYQEFVLPYTTDLIKQLRDVNGMICYHICGDTSSLVEDMVSTGCSMLSIDNCVDLEATKHKVGDKICLVGNVDPVKNFMMGTAEEMDEAVKDCFRKAYDNPCGYVLSSGCDLPVDVPLENMDAFMAAGRKYGRWPLNPDLYV